MVNNAHTLRLFFVSMLMALILHAPVLLTCRVLNRGYAFVLSPLATGVLVASLELANGAWFVAATLYISARRWRPIKALKMIAAYIMITVSSVTVVTALEASLGPWSPWGRLLDHLHLVFVTVATLIFAAYVIAPRGGSPASRMLYSAVVLGLAALTRLLAEMLVAVFGLDVPLYTCRCGDTCLYSGMVVYSVSLGSSIGSILYMAVLVWLAKLVEKTGLAGGQ